MYSSSDWLCKGLRAGDKIRTLRQPGIYSQILIFFHSLTIHSVIRTYGVEEFAKRTVVNLSIVNCLDKDLRHRVVQLHALQHHRTEDYQALVLKGSILTPVLYAGEPQGARSAK